MNEHNIYMYILILGNLYQGLSDAHASCAFMVLRREYVFNTVSVL